ncbi:calcium/sodium antiporter [Candidatus Woesebacteria bacterium]|nr:calcium/sodium antiporter [Candidatus Woesebacteria bacterium]MCD8507703.1 calcium/sodium antiporter [Candidatus Woesebacteria bacterium]MCD8527124.1 calcium/sodium antiporter [Candidatus Woesebacteria bacterium]MCD8546839.1 calcium/sodium antiporter [Candidatus Woesebacteria bacterium]
MFVALGLVALLVITFYLLAVICDEFFVESLDHISNRLKLSSDVAGATFMAMGSSAPELFTSLIAVFRAGGGHADVGAGTIVGSAIFNILVIIGASAAFKTAKLRWQPVVRDTLFYSLSILLLLWAFWDARIVLTEAVLFIALYVAYLIAVVKWKKIFPYKDVDPIDIVEKESKKSELARVSKRLLRWTIPDSQKYPDRYLITFVMSIVWIAVLSFVLVESAVHLGEILHINPTIIALTVLAAGTSIPDLLSSVIVAKRGRGDMAVSNAVGSNVFDILFGLGVPWTLVLVFQGGYVPVANENLIGSVFLLFATVVAVFFLLVLRRWRIGPRAGWLLIGLYLMYLAYKIVPLLL